MEEEGGIDSIQTLKAVPISGIDALLKSLRRAAEKTAVNDGDDRPSFSYIAGVRLMAFRMWIAYRVERGQPTTSPAFTEEAMTRFVTRLDELYELKASDETTGDPSGPPKLKSFEDWETWLELMTTHLSHVRNSTLGTPFTYLIRDVREPELWTMTGAQRAPFLLPYEDQPLDTDLVATSRFDGPSFQRDNHQLFDSLKVLTIEGNCWTFIERYKSTRNGRAAFLMLKAQAEGDFADTAKKNTAYSLIEKAHFSGKGKFTLASYTAIHQSAHNKLEQCKEPVPETKKVTDYLLGITAPALITAKEITHSRNDLSTNFAACQQFMQSTYGKINTVKGASRNVSGVDTNQGQKRPDRKSFPKKKTYGKNSNNKTRHYPKDVWKKMVESGEAKKIMDARKAKAEQRIAASATTDSSMAATLASLAKTVSALAAKSGVTISSVTSKTEDESTLSVITTEDGATTKPKAVAFGDAPSEEAAPLVTNEKKKHPPGETTKARLESAGGQFGRNGVGTLNKQSFPTAAVKAATGMQISSVATEPPPKIHETYVVSAPTPIFTTDGASETFRGEAPTVTPVTVTTPENWLKPKTKRRLSHKRTKLPLSGDKKRQKSLEPREPKPRRAKKTEENSSPSE
jgi:hypothetical protein